MDKPEWMRDAACRGMDPELFFPARGYTGHDMAPAKAVCSTCPVIRDCLAYALRNGEKVGVWGGLSEQERRRRRRSA